MTLPHTPEAERGFIAKCLVDPSQIAPLVGSIEPDDFHDELLGRAWQVMVDNASDARRLDATTLKAAGVDLGDPLEFISRATSAPPREYAEIIKLDSTRRRAILALRGAERRIRTASMPGVYEAVQEAVTTVLSSHRGGGLFALSDLVHDFNPATGGISWGLSALDRAIQPAQGSDLIIVAARPNVGKSAVSMEMALSMSEGSDLPVMFTTIEMSREQLVKRLAHRAGGLDQFRTGYNLVIHDEPRATTATVRASLARLRVQHGGVKALFVDYLQIMKDQGEPEHIRVGRISGELKAIAREFAIPVVAMCQLNRASESREDRRPKLADLRDSGAIEQDADIVLGLYRERLNSSALRIGVLKNRHGRAGDWLDLYFDLDSVSVVQD